MQDQFIKITGNQIEANLELLFIKEGDFLIAYSPVLDISAYGENFEDSLKSFEYTLSIFFKDMLTVENIDAELQRLGWARIDHRFIKEMNVNDILRNTPINLIRHDNRQFITALA